MPAISIHVYGVERERIATHVNRVVDVAKTEKDRPLESDDEGPGAAQARRPRRTARSSTDYPVPQAIEGHVVIRVRASSFNYHDVFTVQRHARHQGAAAGDHRPRHGRRDRRGRRRASTGWKAGDRVLVNPLNKKKGLMGEMLDGGMAEYCLVAADQLDRACPTA